MTFEDEYDDYNDEYKWLERMNRKKALNAYGRYRLKLARKERRDNEE